VLENQVHKFPKNQEKRTNVPNSSNTSTVPHIHNNAHTRPRTAPLDADSCSRLVDVCMCKASRKVAAPRLSFHDEDAVKLSYQPKPPLTNNGTSALTRVLTRPSKGGSLAYVFVSVKQSSSVLYGLGLGEKA